MSSSDAAQQSPGRAPVRTGDRYSNPVTGAPSSPGLRTTQRAENNLVSITVRKDYRGQRSGISLVERQGGVYVTNIVQDGLFGGTDVEEGDRILSMNGIRLQHGDTVKNILRQIHKSNELTVTMVIKKANKSTSGSLSGHNNNNNNNKRKPLRMFKTDALRYADGSLNASFDPRCLPRDEEEYDQISIRARRIAPGQATGVTFVDYDKKVFITQITTDSIFRGTDLSVGDRVVAVNGMSFMSYADANLATKQSQKEKDVVIVVEKGHQDIPEAARIALETEEVLIIDDVDGVNTSSDDDDDNNKMIGKGKQFHMSLSGSSLHSVNGGSARSLSSTANNQSFSGRSLSSKSCHSQSTHSGGKKAKPLKGKRAGTVTNQKVPEIDVDDDSSTSSSSGESISSVESLGDERSGLISPRGLRPSRSGSIKKMTRVPQTPLQQTVRGLGSPSNGSSGSTNRTSSNVSRGSPKFLLPSRVKKEQDEDRSIRYTDKNNKGRSTQKSASRIDCRKSNNEPAKSSTNTRDAPDSSESSLEGDIKAALSVLFPTETAELENDGSLQASVSKIQPYSHDGDFIRITIAKNSEKNPGVKLKKMGGKFVLVGLPENERRIPLGVHVLAVNGQMDFSTSRDAREIMNKTKGHVILMIDFSSPIMSRRLCPCCGDPIFGNGDHVSGHKGPGRRKADDDQSVFSDDSSDDSSDNSLGGGAHSVPDRAAGQKISYSSESYNGNYSNFNGKYDSDSSESLNDLVQPRPKKKTSIGSRAVPGRFNTGDKFMVRVTKPGGSSGSDQELGLSLVEHEGTVYVGRVEQDSLFSSTPIEDGDVVISINGVRNIKHASEAIRIIEGPRSAICMYVLRADKTSPEVTEALKKCR